ncbi:MAG: hypothetical protein ACK4K5_10765, partial [Thermosynechococcus sp.]|uniref:hypothetical protein n=1 Tax=Thermosynechococcus sp. TaxID=2814275 RepID=UPI00391DB7DD
GNGFLYEVPPPSGGGGSQVGGGVPPSGGGGSQVGGGVPPSGGGGSQVGSGELSGGGSSSLEELLAASSAVERSPEELEIVAEIGLFNSTEMCSNEAIDEEEEEENLPEVLISRDSTNRYQGLNSFRVIQVGHTKNKVPTCQSKDRESAQR